MYIQCNVTRIKGKEYRATLLCSKYREGGKIKTKVEVCTASVSGYRRCAPFDGSHAR
jgi:hypothetical protein